MRIESRLVGVGDRLALSILAHREDGTIKRVDVLIKGEDAERDIGAIRVCAQALVEGLAGVSVDVVATSAYKALLKGVEAEPPSQCAIAEGRDFSISGRPC
jgi:hypothetical protein